MREYGGSAPDPFHRLAVRDRLEREEFDVLVIGGGITGVGVALDAASRGLRTALVDRHDFASGTSSKSSKLVHGGLRYLQQGDVRLVREALHERHILLRNAEYLVEVLPFMIPILTKDGLISRKIARALGSALWMYDIAGGWRIGRLHRRLNGTKALSHVPTMDGSRLASAYIYFDARTDDARLCLAIARTAADHGAAVMNYAPVTGIRRTTRGYDVTIRDMENRRSELIVSTRSIVNAAGVWVDEVLALDHAEQSPVGSIRPAKGIHLTLPWDKIRNDIAVVIPVPKDRRSLFLIPWGPRPDGTFTHTFVGTTDTDYSGPLDDPQCTKDDIDYVLGALTHSVTTPITQSDVVGAWAGLRPLVTPMSESPTRSTARTADLSRRHRVSVHDAMVSVTGGKLTTYREMAQDAVDALAPILGLQIGRFGHHRCRTKKVRIIGSGPRRSVSSVATRGRSVRIDQRVLDHLWHRYGTRSQEIFDIIAAEPSMIEPLVPGLDYVRAEVVYAVRSEMAITLEDVLARRTRSLLFDRSGSASVARTTASIMAPLLDWDVQRVDEEVAAYLALCEHETIAASLNEADLRA